MKDAVTRVIAWAAGPAGFLAGLGTRAPGALIVLAVLVIVLVVVLVVFGRGMIRWIIDSGDRSDRMARLISACRGDTKPQAPGSSAVARTPLRHRAADGNRDAAGPLS